LFTNLPTAREKEKIAMLIKDELLALLSDEESDRVERTTSTTNTDKFCEAVCAFANDYPNLRFPGYLIICSF
jgi:ATP-dependent DNA helicase RecG